MKNSVTKNSGNGIGVGATLGLLISICINNNPKSMAFGLCIGVVVGAIFDFIKSRKKI